ncbi:16507_t:CDS:2 [Racocetra fulgida]|uniref:16507_t:CDS:1 n=1 Tax=Racocetra fulgida TaxID=60492 RepID=A0A9N9AGU1_9GLOM|nr:16507_t:CDS:2 [Racocetra fulgida]
MFQSKDSTFVPCSCQQPTSSIRSNIEIYCVNVKNDSNIEIDCVNFESDEHLDNEFDDQLDYEFEEQVELYKGQPFNTINEAYAAVEAFAHSNGFGIRKGRVEKDTSNDHEISRMFLCRHAGKPLKEKKSYKIEESGSYKKKSYAETIGIAHKAINIAIEMDDPDVLRFLKEYITRKGHSLVENTTSVYMLKEQSKSNIPETSSVRSFVENTTSINILKENSKSNISETSPIRVSNLIKKEQSSKNQGKRLKLTRSPGTNTCGECRGKGHNRRWHAKHGKKVHNMSIICQLCGGSGHKKELHDCDSVEVNDENKWVKSSDLESESE